MLKYYTPLLIILIVFFSSSLLFGQSKKRLPYPILFVHGWTGSDQTWYEMLVQLKNQGCNLDINQIEKRAGTGSRIEFLLNADLSTTTLNRNGAGPEYGDVYDLMSYINPDNDVFAINFNVNSIYPTVQSNQAAVVKQGFAVGVAVKKILQATGADKVVLFGHSMGGLAIREYLQNTENWLTKDGSHHVVKLITSGTPHQGSDITTNNLVYFFGKDETSDAVRDMRVSMSPANYLYGGFEGNVPALYQTKDIDCNGYLNYVTGLNQKPMYLNLHFACIVGIGGNSIGWPGLEDDDVVKSYSANIFNLTYDKPMKGDLFIADNNNQQYGNGWEATWHTKLPKQTFLNQYALDEPAELELAYEIKPGKRYQAFFTPDPRGSDMDYDRFKINFDQRGILDFKTNKNKNGGVQLFNWDGVEIKDLQRESRVRIGAGSYSIGIYGETGASNSNSLHFVNYEFSTEFCPLPDLPSIVTEGNASICDGETVTLKLNNTGYDSYTWYKDGIHIGSGLSVTANSPGIYSVQGQKCGVSERSVNEVALQVKPKPSKPVITLQDNALTSSAEKGNQWFANGTAITGENQQKLTSIGAASYSVKVTENGCTAESDVFAITGIEDPALIEATVVFPNPASKFVEITTPLKGELNFRIIDMTGKHVNEYKRIGGKSPSRIPLDQKPGVYFLKVDSKKGSVTKPFLIE